MSVSTVRKLRRARTGLSLLEVMLALAILGVALVMIGQLVRLGVRSAENAQQISHAQILCDTKMAELSAGIIPLESTANTEIEEAPGWVYSVEVENADQVGLLKTKVLVLQVGREKETGRYFELTRLMPDPDYDPYEPVDQ